MSSPSSFYLLQFTFVWIIATRLIWLFCINLLNTSSLLLLWFSQHLPRPRLEMDTCTLEMYRHHSEIPLTHLTQNLTWTFECLHVWYPSGELNHRPLPSHIINSSNRSRSISVLRSKSIYFVFFFIKKIHIFRDFH